MVQASDASKHTFFFLAYISFLFISLKYMEHGTLYYNYIIIIIIMLNVLEYSKYLFVKNL